MLTPCNVIFFAHCGLEKHFISVEKNDKGAFVRYIDDLPKLRDIIKEMLLQRIQ
ncbi:TM1812 family CRISPR-associated protein [Caldicellulosiruptor acetigenus]|uniref:TM1812 family CRISPR-associated protein n=1 Tax=Caldicellulosiruptor acetigenus TaxID=301953 RepID=UPI003A5C4ECB